jgi:hypothetical protein
MLKVVRRDAQICQICHQAVPDDKVEFDHVIPLSRGGPFTSENIRLVNRIFGRSGHPSLLLGDPERQAYRDLLSGLYGVFRNRYAHSDDGGSWYEADAVLSMVNCVLKQLDSMVGARRGTV